MNNPNQIIASLIEIACHAHALVGKNHNRDYGQLTTALRQLDAVPPRSPDGTAMTGPARAAQALESFLGGADMSGFFDAQLGQPCQDATEHLLSSDANAARLAQSIGQLRAGEAKPRELIRDERTPKNLYDPNTMHVIATDGDGKPVVTSTRSTFTPALDFNIMEAALDFEQAKRLRNVEIKPHKVGELWMMTDMPWMDAIHYPEHWDTAAYPTVADALAEVYADFKCTDESHAADAPLIYPAEFNIHLRAILGTMCFQVIRFMPIYRVSGFEIPNKAEDEQAFMLDRLLRSYLKNGDKWEIAINDEMRALHKKMRGEKIKGKSDQIEHFDHDGELPSVASHEKCAYCVITDEDDEIEHETCKFCGMAFESPCEAPPSGPCEQANNAFHGSDPTKPRPRRDAMNALLIEVKETCGVREAKRLIVQVGGSPRKMAEIPDDRVQAVIEAAQYHLRTKKAEHQERRDAMFTPSARPAFPCTMSAPLPQSEEGGTFVRVPMPQEIDGIEHTPPNDPVQGQGGEFDGGGASGDWQP